MNSFSHLTDDELLSTVRSLVERERHATAQLIASLAELDERRLYRGAGCASLFAYCTQILYLSEHAAYLRIETARAARRFPIVLELLSDGSITLTAVGLLSPHLTPDNHRDVLAAVRHRSKRDVEHLVAQLHPRPDVQSAVRKLPSPTPACEPVCGQQVVSRDAAPPAAPSVPLASARPAVVKPIAPERYAVHFTVGRETREKLRRVQDLLRHTIPNGDPAAIFDRALTVLLEHLERQKLAATDHPRPPRPTPRRSRHIPASVKRAVWARDAGQCGFVGTNGRRCTETGFLEVHHVEPYAVGGTTTIENLALRCRVHNGYEAEQYFGSLLVREAQSVWPEVTSTRSGPS